MDEPQYCDVCCLRICAGRCGCGHWHSDEAGVYQRDEPAPEWLVKMRPERPVTPDVMLCRLARRLIWAENHPFRALPKII